MPLHDASPTKPGANEGVTEYLNSTTNFKLQRYDVGFAARLCEVVSPSLDEPRRLPWR
jgi:hypothetical protein